MKTTDPSQENNQIPSSNLKVILFLTVTFCLLLAALTVDAMLVDKDLLRQILQFVQYGLMAIVAIVGGKAVRGILGR